MHYTLAGQGSDKEEGMYKFYTDEPVYLASGIVMEIFCHVKEICEPHTVKPRPEAHIYMEMILFEVL